MFLHFSIIKNRLVIFPEYRKPLHFSSLLFIYTETIPPYNTVKFFVFLLNLTFDKHLRVADGQLAVHVLKYLYSLKLSVN